MLSAAESERAVDQGPVAFAVARDVVRATGADATAYLQGQLSQDVGAVGVGSSAWALLLQPQGKVDVWLRLTHIADDEWLLDTDHGSGEAMVARLERFRLRTAVRFEPLDWSMLAVRGPGSGAVEPPPGAVTADPAWPGLDGVDLLGPSPGTVDGVPEGPPQAYDVLRIRWGIPVMGRELTERTIPAEAGIVERSVSFTKGCYVGQELVARIDSRGNNTPRRLWRLRIEGADAPEPGTPVELDGVAVGEITSAAPSVREGVVALAYLKRGVEPPASPVVEVGGVARPARLLD
jgi:tRNA-modifying protein YgfZ